MTLRTLALTAAVKARALELGFDDVAVGPADPPDHGAAFERWLDAGHAGEMSYLERGRADRLDPARLLAGCRSVVAVALAYGPREASPGWSGIARYARGRDYHDVMRPRLAALVATLREAGGPDVRSRAAVDTSAVLERDLAARAGLGWIGKNTNLLHPVRGSYVFLGIVLTTAELTFDSPAPDRCGSCTACLDACPTEAFVAPYVLDARRCIAYLTIEHRGEIDARWRGRLGGWLFGCDLCQEVCPWNRKAPPARDPVLAPADPPPAAEDVLGMDEPTFRQRFRGSALKRARRSGLARNAALVLSRRTDPAALAALRRACTDGDPVVAATARWAVAGAPAPTEQEITASRWHRGCGGHGKPVHKEDSVADKFQKDDGKDVESGKPVQLDEDQDKQPGHQPGPHQPGHQKEPAHQQPGHQQDRPGQPQPAQRPGGEPGRQAR